VSEGLRPDDELRALRRLATLVAEGVPPQRLFAVVADEVARVLEVPTATVLRYESDGTVTSCARSETGPPLELGTRFALDGPSVLGRIRSTWKPARIDDYSTRTGELPNAVRVGGVRSAVGTPIIVSGRLWGAIVVSSPRTEPLPEGTEARLEDFTQLLATAIANAESHAALERLADEQAALRRVATLVAQGVPPAEIFAAVSDEVDGLFDCGAGVARFEDDVPASVFAGVSKRITVPIGTRFEFQRGMASAEVYRTHQSARVDGNDWSTADGALATTARRVGLVSSVASPIVVDGRLWGTMNLWSTDVLLPRDTGDRLEKFTELVATAIANAESHEAARVLADEQAALRRVATLVAHGGSPPDLFEVVAEEVGRLLSAGSATMGRFEPDDSVTIVAAWSATEVAFPVGVRWRIEGTNIAWRVLQTGRAARLDDFFAATDPIGVAAREAGYESAVGSPIVVKGHIWGLVTATSSEGPLPPGTEARLASFTELVATAIANAESSSELAASRRRIVAASDEARRRIERNLHDGTQQRLVSLAVAVRATEADVPSDLHGIRSELTQIATELGDAVVELQEITRGIHPASLEQSGLGAALRTLGRRSPIPVVLDIAIEGRLPEPTEVAAYYVASEALANAVKHADSTRIEVSLARHHDSVTMSIRDNGIGGADTARGSGLVGLTDRVEALGGSLEVRSPSGHGTQITAVLPLDAGSGAALD
jgi:signal transduction histidine kinase